MLWLDKHRPNLKVIPPEVQERLDAGNEFGDHAMSMFGDYEEMTVYLPGKHIPDKKRMAENTVRHLALGTPVICEAAFIYYNHYCAADILKKGSSGYDLYEVKNTDSVQEQHVRDAAFQTYIIQRCGIQINRVFIVLHGPDKNHPFVPVEISDEAKKLTPWIDEHIWDLNRMQKEREEVQENPGEQCEMPYRCWYYDYCHHSGNKPTQQLSFSELF